MSAFPLAISVLVPSYQGAQRLPRLLDSLEHQETNRDWEIVVVLDGSTDESAELLSERAESLPLRIVVLPENAGRPAALNAGFEASRGDVIIRCDDDFDLPPHYVEGHASWHDTNADVGVVGLPRNRYEPTPYSRAYGVRADQLLAVQAYATPTSHRWVHWCGNCSVGRRLWAEVGAYSLEFASRGEDFEWGYRLAQAGATIVLDPALEVEHRYSADSAEKRLVHAFLTGQANTRFDRCHGRSRAPRDTDVRARAWKGLVRVGACFSSTVAYGRLGAAIDRALPYMSPRWGYRLTSWGVDAAAEAGRRSD